MKQKNTHLSLLIYMKIIQGFNPLTAKLFNWNFYPLEVVSWLWLWNYNNDNKKKNVYSTNDTEKLQIK